MSIQHDRHRPVFNATAPCLQDDTTVRGWFKDWKEFYGKKYATTAAANKAYANFKKNMKRVKQINGKSDLPYWASGNM